MTGSITFPRSALKVRFLTVVPKHRSLKSLFETTTVLLSNISRKCHDARAIVRAHAIHANQEKGGLRGR